MKTEFKVGQKVWDAVNFPNEEGVVDEIDESIVFVYIKNGRYGYDYDGLFISGQIPSLKPYPYTVEFKEKKSEPVVGQYYYFWDNGDESAIWAKFSGIIKGEFTPLGYGSAFHNISETPPFK
jgi:hypothetical protein